QAWHVLCQIMVDFNLPRLTINDFLSRYPNDDICLQEIFNARYSQLKTCPSCNREFPKFYRVKKRKCYECSKCGHQIYPLAGTVIEGTGTPLMKWFYAMYLFSVSKNGVSAKELQRHLGITYKCAWRIGHKIRELMRSKPRERLSGTVEIDESLFGGKAKRGSKRGWGAGNKICLLGMIERGGNVRITPIPNREKVTILPLIVENVQPGTIINTDEFHVYRSLTAHGFKHEKVNHSKYQWANMKAYTNSMEGYWSNLQKSIFGTHTYVSAKYLNNYLGEFEFRHNNRKADCMFNAIAQLFFPCC
ncbi:MAG: IS1595 family transposase, partial [Chitinophagaceae bacterium]|nr:IS1595 family transposase [Chitinophagaceae bacterium]